MYIDFNGSPQGPMWGVNKVMVSQDFDGMQHTLSIYPDIQNDNLRISGKPMHFYIMPESVRMAKNDQGQYMFHFTKFAGVLTEDSNIAVKGQEEVAGGVLSFTSTLALPPGVIDSLKDQITQEIKQDKTLNAHALFMFGQNAPPSFELGFVPIDDSQVTVSNLTLDDMSDPTKTQAPDDQWLWRMQGQGAGNIDANGTNACSAMLGQFPASLVEAGFKGDSSSIFVHEALKLMFRTPSITLKVHADYSKMYSAFSSNSKYKGDWSQYDIKSAFEDSNMRGMFHAELDFGDLDLSDKEKQGYMDMLQQAENSVMDNIKKYMFDKQPAPPEQAVAADTHSTEHHSFLGIINWTSDSDEGYSYALNTKFDASSIQMDYDVDIQGPYHVLQTVSSDMKGFFQEIQKNPDTVKEYFDFVNLGDAFKKLHIIATSRANWPDSAGNGDPLDKLSISVGYSDKNGVVQYKNSGRYYDNLSKKLSEDFKPAIWTKDDTDTVFVFDFAVDDNVPKDLRNVISVKRTVTYKMDERVKINADNEIVVPDETTTDTQIEVKADVVGHLNVGPVYLAADLNKHMLVEVTFNKDGFNPVTVMFSIDNVTQKQSFELWTDEEGVIPWSYKVKVTYKSFGPMQAVTYEGEEVKMEGSYSRGITINLPKPPDDFIQKLTEYKAQEKQLEALDA